MNYLVVLNLSRWHLFFLFSLLSTIFLSIGHPDCLSDLKPLFRVAVKFTACSDCSSHLLWAWLPSDTFLVNIVLAILVLIIRVFLLHGLSQLLEGALVTSCRCLIVLILKIVGITEAVRVIVVRSAATLASVSFGGLLVPVVVRDVIHQVLLGFDGQRKLDLIFVCNVGVRALPKKSIKESWSAIQTTTAIV